MRELDKIIGYEDIKKDLFHIIDVLNNPAKYSALGVSVPQGILLSGNPGIGKSLMAKCFMKETGRTEYIIRKDRPNGSFVNYIRTIFNTALKNAPSIILLDDMDKLPTATHMIKMQKNMLPYRLVLMLLKEKMFLSWQQPITSIICLTHYYGQADLTKSTECIFQPTKMP